MGVSVDYMGQICNFFFYLSLVVSEWFLWRKQSMWEQHILCLSLKKKVRKRKRGSRRSRKFHSLGSPVLSKRHALGGLAAVAFWERIRVVFIRARYTEPLWPICAGGPYDRKFVPLRQHSSSASLFLLQTHTHAHTHTRTQTARKDRLVSHRAGLKATPCSAGTTWWKWTGTHCAGLRPKGHRLCGDLF